MINPADFGIEGLTDEAVLRSRKSHGKNILDYKKENSFLDALKSVLKEPMVLLLAVASSIYFISGNVGDGIFLASAIVLVASISLYQDSRSRKALEKLKNLTQPNSRVVRNGSVVEIRSDEIVIGDSLMVEEGNIVPADGGHCPFQRFFGQRIAAYRGVPFRIQGYHKSGQSYFYRYNGGQRSGHSDGYRHRQYNPIRKNREKSGIDSGGKDSLRAADHQLRQKYVPLGRYYLFVGVGHQLF